MTEIGYIEAAHGHKGSVKVAPVKGREGKIMGLRKVILLDKRGKSLSHEVYDVRKYSGGRFLVRFKGLRWRDEVQRLVCSRVAV